MSVEDDPEHVIGLALVPIVSGPNLHEGRDVGIAIWNRDFKADATIIGHGEKWIDRMEFTALVVGIMNATDAKAILETK